MKKKKQKIARQITENQFGVKKVTKNKKLWLFMNDKTVDTLHIYIR